MDQFLNLLGDGEASGDKPIFDRLEHLQNVW